MDRFKKNIHVIHPKKILIGKKTQSGSFNNKLEVKITNMVGSMWSAYLFGILSLLSLPAILVLVNPHLRSLFPSWIVAGSLITLIAWISQNFLQLVLLPVIMVGQNVIQDHQQAKAEADHRTLTYIANLQEEQMKELEAIKLKIRGN